ncbi:MAG: hypothetical protein A2527_02555 [Candidatus Lambdaproteobacteria bacterium RIFOXYD2_FULL_50_16]|uniref:Outer membrane protein beta-barrel domain-containing protein n=1 Tax=Candidatus Lambdaproteobacteria bacterium RIFOXYD2_FULL_50_16 TaxID=1817772 RepID=A0A1F6GFR7_9PROT|nr:MAG: hypothetical protein A2527_02555 [Candidatus Lambdaproteobacteria bacterium RIFOXYD2_FULL_50_16]
MAKRTLLLLFAVLLMAAPVKAETWVSASLPTSFSFSSYGNPLYDFDQVSSTSTAGYSLLASLPVPLLPIVGLSEFVVQLVPSSPAITGTNQMRLNTYDVAFDFSGKNVGFLLGYGAGKATFECAQSDCSNLTFYQREVIQYFGQLGVPFGTNADFHLEARRVIGRVQVDSGVQALDLDLQGMLFAFGFRIGF